ncbi:MAG: hypothetical protein OXP70_04355 [Acidobacteriota bacterium]|nr:hypothetical protein [Acidobacteriota bacterium]
MTQPDLKTDSGLREACADMERRTDPERLATVTQFLEDVAAVPRWERASREFQIQIWKNNPIHDPGWNTYEFVGESKLSSAELRTWFADRTSVELPTDWKERAEMLADVFWETVDRFETNRGRPRRQMLRTLAALFPEHLTGAVAEDRLYALQARLGSSPLWAEGVQGVERECRDQLLYSFWIRHRLVEVLGKPETMAHHARHLLLSGELAELVSEEGGGTSGGRPKPVDHGPCWFVGAVFGDEDQTDRFLRDGVWENGYDDRYLDAVKSIEPGNRIAIKSTYTKKHGLPFDNRGESTSTMAIKATGVVTENMGDGRKLRVQWTPMEPHREWYFYTERTTLWKVTPGSGALPWAANALIDFAFNGAEQDYDRFLRHWFPERYEDDAPIRAASVPPLGEIVERVQAAARERGLAFSRALIESLHLGLWANQQRHFAILAGLSGSGKTQLAMEYASALTGADDESSVRLCAVSAAPGWHDPSPLLGYVNPLDGSYAGTDFQRFLLNAAGNPKEVHVCVLDEMNLSHPEQYLAPLLSAMERDGGMVEFHDSDEMALGVPQRIPYPRNLVLIGTVNMDETTMGISDKVLDRAFTLEFWDIDVDEWPGWEGCALADDERDGVLKLLNALIAALRPARLHFGWRVIAEFVAFLERRAADSADIPFDQALDQITYAKVLPKLRGDDSQRYRTALEACRKVLDDEGLSKSAQKVEELMQDLDETGSFRFWR